MNQHLELESLSAYLDGELDPAARGRVEQHLAGCSGCSAEHHRLAAAAGAVAGLPAIQVTEDEHRAIRRAILDSAPPRRAGRVTGATGWLQWSLAGGLVLVAVTALGLGFVRFGQDGRDTEALTEAAAPVPDAAADGSTGLVFASGSEVDRAVGGLPEVIAGLRIHGSEDPPAMMFEALPRTDAAPEGEAGTTSDPHPDTQWGGGVGGGVGGDGGGGESSVLRESAGDLAGEEQDPFSAPAGTACLDRVAATQPDRMVPLVARPASFQGRDAWLLVFAWSPDPNSPLDRWQAWIVDPQDCRSLTGPALESSALYRSSSPAG